MDEELARLVSRIRASTASPSSPVDPTQADRHDDSIPTLTDIVEQGDSGFAPAAVDAPDPSGATEAFGHRDLEQRIVEQILDRLRRDLEKTIRKALEPVVRQAVHEALARPPHEPTL